MTGWRKRQIQMEQDKQQEQLKIILHVTETEDLYAKGWNDSLEMAAVRLQADFRQSFGADTCASWAAWLRGHKVQGD